MSEEIVYKTKICVVDDEPFIRDIYKTELERNGFEVSTAVDGEDGIRVIKENRPDVVLVDISMPKKDGIELMEEIRSDKELSRVKIIVATNFDDPKIIQQVEKFNTSFYLVKALYDPQKIAGIVREVIAG